MRISYHLQTPLSMVAPVLIALATAIAVTRGGTALLAVGGLAALAVLVIAVTFKPEHLFLFWLFAAPFLQDVGSGRLQHLIRIGLFSAPPLLFLACATGQHIASAKLTCREAGGGQQEFLTVTFTDLRVSSYQTGGSSDATVIPVDQISINFGQIEFEYKPQKPDGTLDASVVAGYNVATNAKV